MTRDDGTVLVQAIGGVLLALLVAITCFDVGAIFNARTALHTAANDVALRAATAIDVEALYAAPIGATLALDPELATGRAMTAAMDVADPRLTDVRLDDVEVVGDAVRVVLSAAVPHPLGPIVGERTFRIRAAAAAGTPTRF